MLRKLSCILLAVLMLLSLTACGGTGNTDSDYLGVWVVTNMEMFGMNFTAKDLASTGGGISFDLQKDGKAIIKMDNGSGEDQTEGEWGRNGNNIVITDSSGSLDLGGENLIFAIENETLVLTQEIDRENIKITLAREDSDIYKASLEKSGLGDLGNLLSEDNSDSNISNTNELPDN